VNRLPLPQRPDDDEPDSLACEICACGGDILLVETRRAKLMMCPACYETEVLLQRHLRSRLRDALLVGDLKKAKSARSLIRLFA